MTLKLHKVESKYKKTNRKSAKIELDKQQEVVIEEDLNNLFFFHPKSEIDIAIVNLNQSLLKKITPLVMPIEIDKIVPDNFDENIEIYDDITFIGYPNSLYDKKNLLPIIRKGSFATPYQVDFDGHPIFLIDASVFPGSSGSPVFLFDRTKTLFQGKRMDLVAPRIFFLGIVARVYQRDELFNLIEVTDIKAHGQQMIDIGVVYKAAEIRKLIKYYIVENVFKAFIEDNLNISDIDHEEEMDVLITTAIELKESNKCVKNGTC